MTGNISPATGVLGATSTTAVSAGLLANTGNPVFQTILVGAIIVSIVLLVTRLVKITVSNK